MTRGFFWRVEEGRRAEFFFCPPTFTVMDVFLAFAINVLLLFYFCCSRARVFVVWSQTSVGPKYWIGPG
jgi:hypothetical protein